MQRLASVESHLHHFLPKILEIKSNKLPPSSLETRNDEHLGQRGMLLSVENVFPQFLQVYFGIILIVKVIVCIVHDSDYLKMAVNLWIGMSEIIRFTLFLLQN